MSVLVVSASEDDHVFFGHLFSHSNWRVEQARSCKDASTSLGRGGIGVTLCACELPDGTWRDVLAGCAASDDRPRLIVLSSAPDDRLWTEVLDSGGYDLLAKPPEPREVVRVVSLAWRQWRDEREREQRSVGR